MPRFFNTAGPCDPRTHYMLPLERRLPGVRGLIDQQHYFVLHAPRQSGKTTYLRSLAPALTSDGRLAALAASCEVGQAAGDDVDRGIAALLDAIRQAAENHLPEDLRPPKADPEVPAETRLLDLLSRWSKQCPRPVVLFLDEIDSLLGSSLVSVLRQLRSGYPERPESFPQAVALVGLRDVRGTSSFFNIKAESLALPNFSLDEVFELYGQHTVETGQVFTPEAVALSFELTGGHPWLVNALARQAVEVLAPDPAMPVTPGIVEAAKERLIQRRDTHLDSLVDRLREPLVRRLIEPILAGGSLSPEVMDDDIQLVLDLGLMKVEDGNLVIANPIYREVIALTWPPTLGICQTSGESLLPARLTEAAFKTGPKPLRAKGGNMTTEPPDVLARLDELRLLKDGWFEGSGSAPTSAGIDWLSDKFTQTYPEDLPLPFVYPTPEGGIRLEWSLEPHDLTLDIDLAKHVASLHALSLSSNEEREDGFNLDEPLEWARLIEQIKDRRSQALHHLQGLCTSCSRV